jgi:hypothetical protein
MHLGTFYREAFIAPLPWESRVPLGYNGLVAIIQPVRVSTKKKRTECNEEDFSSEEIGTSEED